MSNQQELPTKWQGHLCHSVDELKPGDMICQRLATGSWTDPFAVNVPSFWKPGIEQGTIFIVDVVLVDDPHSPDNEMTRSQRDEILKWYEGLKR